MNRAIRVFVLTLGILFLLGCEESTQPSAQNMGSILGAETQTDDETQKEAEQFTPVVKGIDITCLFIDFLSSSVKTISELFS